MNQPDQQIADWMQLVEDCEARESRLSDWERTFVDSVKMRLSRGQHLSDKQSGTLDDIWEKATSKG